MHRFLPLAAVLLVGCPNTSTPVDSSDTTEVRFEVKPGTVASRLGAPLHDAGLIDSEFAWTWFLKVDGADGSCLKAGTFALNRAMPMQTLLDTLCGAPIADDVPFTVLEGWRIMDIDKALVRKGLIAPGEYSALATSKGVPAPFDVSSPSYEGFLYPETYMVPPDKARFDPAALIGRQLNTFKARFLDLHQGELGKRSLHEVVIMASMLEREEPKDSQRPIVAGILWKRLDNGWQLGVDATSRYSLDDWQDENAFVKKLKDPADPYGTRMNKGLPPTAIGNPTQSALEAAIKPQASEFWFYLHDHKGVFHGGRDGDHHDRNRAKYDVY